MLFHLKIMLRNLQRGGIYSVINVGGLAIGMAAAILIFAWIYYQWSFDRFHAKEKSLYIAYNRAIVDGEVQCWSSTPNVLGPTLKANYPDIVGMTRMVGNTFLYANGEASFKIQTHCIDPNFFTMFDFPLLQGNLETTLEEPNSVILTEKTAKRLFGQEDPNGKTLIIDNQYAVTVTGVLKDIPGNTMFSNLEALMPTSFLKGLGGFEENWFRNSLWTFVELHPNARIDRINESIRDIVKTQVNNETLPEVFLYPINKRHLYSIFENGIPVGGLIETLRLYGIIAGLILLIACINFMNLSTARSQKRAKEVGVRKVMGGKRWTLIRLFVGESMLVSFIAGYFALVIASIILPIFNNFMVLQLTLDFSDFRFWLAILGFVLFTGLLAGSYPAFYLSSFRPVKVLKGAFIRKQGGALTRKFLVMFQFIVASALIVSTLVIHRQIRYAQDREVGYDKNNLIHTSLEGDVMKHYELIKQELLKSETAVSMTRTYSPMTESWWRVWSINWRGKDPNQSMAFSMYSADADWTKTVGTTIIEGRDIDIYSYPTDSLAIILNESAVKTMNFENPIGEIIDGAGKKFHVVGVVKDFLLKSPYDAVEPMLIAGPFIQFNTVNIKLNGANRTADNLAKAEQIFKIYNPNYPFEYHFVDEEYARKFQDEKKTGLLATLFAGLTIIISCMGLFALVAYMAETRRKEIGIRKVLGASVYDIIILLSKEFLILVVISVAVASPIAWWAMEKWLTNFAYRTDIPLWLFVAVGGISLGIALLTVGFQAVKAAIENPVESIMKCE